MRSSTSTTELAEPIESTESAEAVAPSGVTPAVYRRCRCGLSHTQDGWDRLHLVGYMRDEVEIVGANGATEVEFLELRNCTCRSTLAMPFEPRPRLKPRA